MESKLDSNDLIYKKGNKEKDKRYHFQKFKTIRSFGKNNYSNDLLLNDTLE